MNESTAVAVRCEEPRGLMASAVAPGEIVGIINHVHAVIKNAFKEGIRGDYAVIPGTGDKPALLKPGAEKLLLSFGLVAHARTPRITEIGGGHREVTVETEIRSLATGNLHAVGLGSCSTMESKYRWRGAGGRECPSCHAVACKPSKKEFGGGYYCDPKAGGCNARFKQNSAEAKQLDGAAVVRQENPDLADTYNTVLKMAKKRSMVDGAIAATASSSMFTQDVEEMAAADDTPELARTEKKAPPAKSALDAARDMVWARSHESKLSAGDVKQLSIDVLGKDRSADWTVDDCQVLVDMMPELAAKKAGVA